MTSPLRRILTVTFLVAALGATDVLAEGHPRVVLHTDHGDITLELYEDVAPKAVENFTVHARNGYFDGTTFHRVEEQFIIQGGDPDGTGYGGKSIWGAPFENEVDPAFGFDEPYALGMANRGVDNTNTSQFFITLAPAPWMTGTYTLFGRVIHGRDVVDTISAVDVEVTQKRPIRDVVLESVEVLDDGTSE